MQAINNHNPPEEITYNDISKKIKECMKFLTAALDSFPHLVLRDYVQRILERYPELYSIYLVKCLISM